MKRLIAFGFPLAAILWALLGPMTEVRAEKPMAVCKDGKWKQVEQAAQAMDEKAQADMQSQYEQARESSSLA